MLSSTLLGPARALRGALPRAAFAAPALALHPRQPSAPLALAGTARPAAASAASAQTYRRNLDINAGVCKVPAPFFPLPFAQTVGMDVHRVPCRLSGQHGVFGGAREPPKARG